MIKKYNLYNKAPLDLRGNRADTGCSDHLHFDFQTITQLLIIESSGRQSTTFGNVCHESAVEFVVELIKVQLNVFSCQLLHEERHFTVIGTVSYGMIPRVRQV